MDLHWFTRCLQMITNNLERNDRVDISIYYRALYHLLEHVSHILTFLTYRNSKLVSLLDFSGGLLFVAQNLKPTKKTFQSSSETIPGKQGSVTSSNSAQDFLKNFDSSWKELYTQAIITKASPFRKQYFPRPNWESSIVRFYFFFRGEPYSRKETLFCFN